MSVGGKSLRLFENQVDPCDGKTIHRPPGERQYRNSLECDHELSRGAYSGPCITWYSLIPYKAEKGVMSTELVRNR